ncbi:hypothetical protein YC2023_089314 [Brassica napus]
MRKVIIVDRTHLKHVNGGVLLVATAQDPDRHHYPIAFGVVDGEKDESWMWFMNKLRSVISDEGELVFLSDRNGSLIKSIREMFPMAAHGYCIWHLSQNVSTTETLAQASLQSVHMLIQWLSLMISMMPFPEGILLLRRVWRKVLK